MYVVLYGTGGELDRERVGVNTDAMAEQMVEQLIKNAVQAVLDRSVLAVGDIIKIEDAS